MRTSTVSSGVHFLSELCSLIQQLYAERIVSSNPCLSLFKKMTHVPVMLSRHQRLAVFAQDGYELTSLVLLPSVLFLLFHLT